jgi:ADP-heptose:LPS heptosyltransferase
MNILLTRTDRLGDLIQSLAALPGLKARFPDGTIGFLIAKANAPVLKDHPCIDRVHYIEEVDAASLRACGYDAAVVLWYDPRVVRLVKAARIRRRLGPLSKFGSFFAFNEGIRQHRSASVKNEAEYNGDLVAALCPEITLERPRIYNKGVAPAEDLPDSYVVLAPQSRNSAPNIPESTYLWLGAAIASKGIPIVVSGIENDPLCKRLTAECGTAINLCGRTSLDELIWVVGHALFVMAPSTGTLHLANALGRPILSFYPPARVVSSVRWAPFRHEGRVFSSPYQCANRCRPNRKCNQRCMNFDAIGEVDAEIEKLLHLGQSIVPVTK